MKPSDLPAEEERILSFWKQHNIFKKSSERRMKHGRPFVFFEGPPTANGLPGIHHVLGRAFKDIILRYKTMRGFWVWRRAGWDTHGLPVELEVEKELGLATKQAVEEFGIAEFNKRCRQSVWKYQKEWERLTERMGFWIDMDDPYITYEADYVENLWAVIKKFWDNGLLFEDFKVVPFCVRCGTSLSSHEVAQGYKTVSDRAVTVKFPISNVQFSNKINAPESSKVYLLAWTTTPWTIPGNIALAVGEDITYVAVKYEGAVYIVAQDLVKKIFKDTYEVLGTVPGKDLVGLSYTPPFAVPSSVSNKSHTVYAADFVTTEEGTGIVHTAVMYGVDDFELGSAVGLPKVHTVREDGTFIDEVPAVGGLPIVSEGEKNSETERRIITHLNEHDALFAEEKHEHEYPFCWRCKSPLLYYARDSWFVAVSDHRDTLVKNNARVTWVPEHIRDGRFGEWLREAKDWAFSRNRYWGTPLPVWRCEDLSCGHTSVIGSRDELNAYRNDTPTTLLLMRHGESLSNVRHIASSYPETFNNTLTEKGEGQVRRAAQRLTKRGIDRIYTSDLTRTHQTAEAVGKALGIPVETDPRLREIGKGDFNGESLEAYRSFFDFLQERVSKAPNGGESWGEVRTRMVETARSIVDKHPGETVLVVSHGIPLALLYATLHGETLDEFLNWEEEDWFKNAEVRQAVFPNWPFNSEHEVDFHRPYIDAITLSCQQCGGGMRRVSELADVWFDSGAMPFAQPTSNNPAVREYVGDKVLGEPLSGQFPADYITEGIDQTRGWFYTLHTISSLLGRGPSYKTALTYGHVLDAEGKKMSKSVGNIVDPWEMIDEYGIDALRWYFYTVNAPGEPKLFDEREVKERHRRFIMTLLHSLTFLKTYWMSSPPPESGPGDAVSAPHTLLDTWIRSRLAREEHETARLLDAADVVGAARRLDTLVQDISNWYIRRSRDRMQTGVLSDDARVAQWTLWEVLERTSRLIAPFTPFVAETLYQRLRECAGTHAPEHMQESVHLTDWAQERLWQVRDEVEERMHTVRSLAQRALAERAREGIKVRQKLSTLFVSPDEYHALSGGYDAVLASEVNVVEIAPDEGCAEGTVRLDTHITPALERDGILREVLRTVNNLRRKAGLSPDDRIALYLSVTKPSGEHETFSAEKDEILKEARADTTQTLRDEHPALDYEREWKERGWTIKVGIQT